MGIQTKAVIIIFKLLSSISMAIMIQEIREAKTQITRNRPCKLIKAQIIINFLKDITIAVQILTHLQFQEAIPATKRYSIKFKRS